MIPVVLQFRVAARLWLAVSLGFSSGAMWDASAQVRAATAPQLELEQARFHRTWQIGAYGEGGFAPDYAVGNRDGFRYEKTLEFYQITFQAGRTLGGVNGSHILRGRPEAIIEVTPFWLADSPLQKNRISSNDPFLNGGVGTFPAYKQHGLAFTPALFRWNFMGRNSRRQVPWLQGGAGVLWTAQNFPQGSAGPGGHTSRFNFTPQLGAGENIFVRDNQSLGFGMRVVLYSNAGLGEVNPGVPYTLNFGIGYSWWK